MKEIRISKTAKGVVKASVVVSNLQKINERYELSKDKANSLFKDLDNTHTKIAKTDSRFFGGYNTSKLYCLISESHEANLITSKNIYDLISYNNENAKELSEMIKTLAMLSGLSFEKIAENSSELDEISKELESSTNNTEDNSTNIKRVVILQLNKVKEEKKRQENIDYNFGILNENFKELQKELQKLKTSHKEIKNLYNTTSEKHFLKVLKKQKKMIYLLFFTLISLIVFLLYIFFVNNIISFN